MTSSVSAQMSRKFDRAVTELAKSKRIAVTKAAQITKDSVDKRLPASKRMRGVGKKGARIGVRYDLDSDGKATVRAVGPLHLLERDTKAHKIAPKSRGRGANRKRRDGAIQLADGSIREEVDHPGTKGKHLFEKGVEAARPKALDAMRNATTDAVKRGLRA